LKSGNLKNLKNQGNNKKSANRVSSRRPTGTGNSAPQKPGGMDMDGGAPRMPLFSRQAHSSLFFILKFQNTGLTGLTISAILST
jgi:hypothetical protein